MSGADYPGPPSAGTIPHCYRHPDRETGVSCSNCGKPICPDCMTATPVGMRCPDCAGKRQRVQTLHIFIGAERALAFLRPRQNEQRSCLQVDDRRGDDPRPL